ncbi:650_t:CDS:2 [Ambispora gerdemannii]|uniref:650_t:CDS:1 n=1 Tax=Ambispora gerdemannii TaxID=144530 RepID=A0A9N9A319_9GLOM|nr:650_t:CDS:2 [Ambispora gerdemannii]
MNPKDCVLEYNRFLESLPEWLRSNQMYLCRLCGKYSNTTETDIFCGSTATGKDTGGHYNSNSSVNTDIWSGVSIDRQHEFIRLENLNNLMLELDTLEKAFDHHQFSNHEFRRILSAKELQGVSVNLIRMRKHLQDSLTVPMVVFANKNSDEFRPKNETEVLISTTETSKEAEVQQLKYINLKTATTAYCKSLLTTKTVSIPIKKIRNKRSFNDYTGNENSRPINFFNEMRELFLQPSNNNDNDNGIKKIQER